jgi:hypothetical protein
MRTPVEIKKKKQITVSYRSKCNGQLAMNSGVWGRVAKFSSRRTSLSSELAWKITHKLVQYKMSLMIMITVGMHVVSVSL